MSAGVSAIVDAIATLQTIEAFFQFLSASSLAAISIEDAD